MNRQMNLLGALIATVGRKQKALAIRIRAILAMCAALVGVAQLIFALQV